MYTEETGEYTRKKTEECTGRKQENIQGGNRRIYRDKTEECTGRKQENKQRRNTKIYRK